MAIRLAAPGPGLAEVIEVFLAGGGVVRVVHTDVSRGLAARPAFFEVLAVATFEDVDFGVVDLGVVVVIEGAILRAEVLGTTQHIQYQTFRTRTITQPKVRQVDNLQGGGALDAEFAMEDQDRLAQVFATGARIRLVGIRAEQELLEGGRGVDVDSAGDVASVVFVVEPAVDDSVGGDLFVVPSVKDVVQLYKTSQTSINEKPRSTTY